jgi:hypothetical protein
MTFLRSPNLDSASLEILMFDSKIALLSISLNSWTQPSVQLTLEVRMGFRLAMNQKSGPLCAKSFVKKH